MSRAVFLDRDGVVVSLVQRENGQGPPLRRDELQLEPGALDAMRVLARRGIPMILVSNQPDAAKGNCELADIVDVHSLLFSVLAEGGVRLAGTFYCFHHPEGVHPELGVQCLCRKPSPAMLIDAAQELGIDLAESWMVGDSDIDVEAGVRAGCHTLLVENPMTGHRRTRPGDVVDLTEAVGVILE